MHTVLLIVELVVAVLLSILILMQNKDGGLSAVMGGGESFQTTKRGPEKVIHYATILLAAVFMINAVLIAVIQ